MTTAIASLLGVALAAPVLVRRRLLVASTAAIPIVAVAVASLVPWTTTAGRLDVAVVQGGGPRGIPAVESDPSQVTARQLAVSGRINGAPDLVLCPEDVVAVTGSVTATPQGAQLAALVRRRNTTLVAGIVEGRGRRFRNAAVAWGPDGMPIGRYE